MTMIRNFYKYASIITAMTFLTQGIVLPEAAAASRPLSISYQPSVNLFIPEQYGRIERQPQTSNLKSQTSKSPQVILVKDAHCNYEAQKNIAKILDILIKDHKIDLIGVEGASGAVDPSVIAGSPDEKTRKEAGDKYLKKGWLTASEALAMQKGRDFGFSIWGVEDLKLYLNDMKVFRDVYSGNKEAERFIEIAEGLINNLRDKIYSAGLREFDAKAVEYRENKIGLTEWLKYSVERRADSAEKKNIRLVLKSIELEEGIDFKKVEKERAELIKECEKKLPKEEIAQLVKMSLEYKLGKISGLEYYKYLNTLIPRPALSFTCLKMYTRLLKLHSKIDEGGLFREIDELTEEIYRAYLNDEISKKLHETDNCVYLIGRLLKLEITRNELDRAKNGCSEIEGITEFLKIQAGANGMSIPPELNDGDFLKKAEDFYKYPDEFYKYAVERDAALIENLVNKMREENKDKAVLIVGGFHADGAEKLLNEKGIRVITITPSITKEDPEAKRIYLERMMDKQFQPEKIMAGSGLSNIQAPLMTAVEWKGIYRRQLSQLSEELRGKIVSVVSAREGMSEEEFKERIRKEIASVKAKGLGMTEGDKVVIGILETLIREAETEVLEEGKPSWSPVRPVDAQAVKKSGKAFEYISPSQGFKGVDLEHFVHAQNRLTERQLTEDQFERVFALLGIADGLNLNKNERYKQIYVKLSESNYTKQIIDIINGDTYSDPRLEEKEVTAQNRNPRAQGIYEAVANSLDALGFKIGQFGKGVKQIIDWLEKEDGDRIDVYTKMQGGVAYRLTIVNDENGQRYIRIQRVSDEELNKAAGAVLEHGAVVKITTRDRIPLTDKEKDRTHYNSQTEIAEGIHRRFPYVKSVETTTRVGENKAKRVNGFGSKKVITKEGVTVYSEEESAGRSIQVIITDNSISVIDNGTGMDAEIISRMFVPKHGTKHPEPLNWQDASAEEKDRIKVVHDETLPRRVSFSRNGEVITAVDIPDYIIEEAAVKGGLMVEFDGFMEVPESRDNIIIPLNLKPGEKSNFQYAVEHAVGMIMKNTELSDVEKIKYINTIVIGLDCLIKGNENYAQVIKRIRAEIQKEAADIIRRLRESGYVILPHDRQFEKISAPDGREILFLHEKLFDWRGVSSIEEIGGKIIRGVTVGGEKKLPLIVIPFTGQSINNISKFNPEWHNLNERERLPLIKTGTFIAIPGQFRSVCRVKQLADKRSRGGLSEREEKEFMFLLQLINNMTAEEVVTLYETREVKKNLEIAGRRELTETGEEIDSDAANRFLRGISNIPSDANQRYTVMENGRIIEIATGIECNIYSSSNKEIFGRRLEQILDEKTERIEAVGYGHYKLITKNYYFLCKGEGTRLDIKLRVLREDVGNIILSPDKRFACVTYSNGTFKDIYDLETGQVYDPGEFTGIIKKKKKNKYLIEVEEGFVKMPMLSIQAMSEYRDMQFSGDGRYMTYLEKPEVSKMSELLTRKINFVIVDLKEKRIVGKYSIGEDFMKGVVYSIDPYTPFAHIQYTDTSTNVPEMHLVSLETGRGVKGFHRAYTNHCFDTIMIYKRRGQESIHILDNEAVNLYGFGDMGPIGKVDFYIEEIKEGNIKDRLCICIMGKSGQVYYEYLGKQYFAYSAHLEDIRKRSILNVQIFLKEGKAYIRFETKNAVREMLFANIDPVRRLDVKGMFAIFRSGYALIIDKSNPQEPVATDALTGDEFPYRGEIVDYDPNRKLLTTVYENKMFEVYSSKSSKLSKDLAIVSAFSDKNSGGIKEYCICYIGENYYLRDLSSGGLFPLANIPVTYSTVFFDGKYFVFSNPKTGDVVYWNPKDLDYHPIFVDSKISRLSSDAQETDEDKDRVIRLRDELISKARSAYQPLLALIPRGYRNKIENHLKKLIEELYRDQEKQIGKKDLKDVDAGDPSLLFSRFAVNMARVIPKFKDYIEYAEEKLYQEDEGDRELAYRYLFIGIFTLCRTADIVNEDIFENNMLFEALSYGWAILAQEDIDAVSDIYNIVKNLQEMGIEPAVIRKIVTFFHSAAVKDMPIFRKQLGKIISARDAVKSRYLTELCSVFRDRGIDIANIISYLNNPSGETNLKKARPFVVFFTNDVEQVEKRERNIPEGEDTNMPGLAISQIDQLERNRKKNPNDPDDVVISIEDLIESIENGNIPGVNNDIESEILRNTTVQRESGAYTAEITQNSRDAVIERVKEEGEVFEGELLVNFYLQDGELGEEYVEEAIDNGTGALNEAALLIPVSTKAADKQAQLTGFFGTGKYTIFEGVDRVEIITANNDRAYMFVFNVNKDPSGNPVAVMLTGIRKLDKSKMKMQRGVMVRRIKAVNSTIPELDQMLAKRAWKSFAGLSQNKNFRIYFLNREGKKQPLEGEGENELLSETDFIAMERGTDTERNFGKMRVISTKDMPLQIIDKAGLRVCEIKEEYLALIPPSLKRHISELGIVIQIPLPLIRNRSAFKEEAYYMPAIQKYIAIEFYKALIYRTLTSKTGSFVFENLSLDWETSNIYWDVISSVNDVWIIGLAEKINKGRYGDTDIEMELKKLLHEAGILDKQKIFLKLMLLLDVITDPAKPKESLFSRRIALQKKIDQERAERQERSLRDAGLTMGEIPDITGDTDFERKIALGSQLIKADKLYMGNYIIRDDKHTPDQREFLNLARLVTGLFGLEQVFLVKGDDITFYGAFQLYGGKRTIFLNASILDKRTTDSVIIDKRADVIIHELAHLLERGVSESLWREGFVSPAFTHDAKGVFAEAMKYAAAVALAGRDILGGLGVEEETEILPAGSGGASARGGGVAVYDGRGEPVTADISPDKGLGIVPKLQEQFGEFGGSWVYKTRVGPIFEEAGLLGYPLILLLRIFKYISADEFSEINRSLRNNFREIAKYSFGAGYRGLPVILGTLLSFIAPGLALAGVILSFTAGFVFVYGHPEGKRDNAFILTGFLSGLLAFIFTFTAAGLISPLYQYMINVALVPVFVFAHAMINKNAEEALRKQGKRGEAPTTLPRLQAVHKPAVLTYHGTTLYSLLGAKLAKEKGGAERYRLWSAEKAEKYGVKIFRGEVGSGNQLISTALAYGKSNKGVRRGAVKYALQAAEQWGLKTRKEIIAYLRKSMQLAEMMFESIDPTNRLFRKKIRNQIDQEMKMVSILESMPGNKFLYYQRFLQIPIVIGVKIEDPYRMGELYSQIPEVPIKEYIDLGTEVKEIHVHESHKRELERLIDEVGFSDKIRIVIDNSLMPERRAGESERKDFGGVFQDVSIAVMGEIGGQGAISSARTDVQAVRGGPRYVGEFVRTEEDNLIDNIRLMAGLADININDKIAKFERGKLSEEAIRAAFATAVKAEARKLRLDKEADMMDAGTISIKELAQRVSEVKNQKRGFIAIEKLNRFKTSRFENDNLVVALPDKSELCVSCVEGNFRITHIRGGQVLVSQILTGVPVIVGNEVDIEELYPMHKEFYIIKPNWETQGTVIILSAGSGGVLVEYQYISSVPRDKNLLRLEYNFSPKIAEPRGSGNIGKGVNFEIVGERLNITGRNGEVLLSNGVAKVGDGFDIKGIIKIVNGLHVGELTGFRKYLRRLQRKDKIRTFAGTNESRAAGALAHMAANGVMYIDEVLFNSDAGVMAIIHEAIHGYFNGVALGNLEEKIGQFGIAKKIREKAWDAGKGSEAKYRNYLIHYYARYYLQNPKSKGKGRVIKNQVLTYEIRLNAVAGILGINAGILREKLNTLGDEKETLRLKNKILKLIKDDRNITIEELDIIAASAYKAAGALNLIKDIVPFAGKERISRIEQALAMYIAAEKLEDLERQKREELMPLFLRGLKEKLKGLAPAKGIDAGMIDGLIEDLYKTEGYYIEGNDINPSPYFELMVEWIGAVFGLEQSDESLKLLNKYKYARVLAKREFGAARAVDLTAKEDILTAVQNFMEKRRMSRGESMGAVRDAGKKAAENLVDVIARYTINPEEILRWFSEEEDKKDIVAKGLESIKKTKSELADIKPPGLAFGNLAGEDNKGVYVVTLEAYKRAGIILDERLSDKGVNLQNNVPQIIDAKLLVGDVKDRGNGDYLIQSLGEGALWLLERAQEQGVLEILYETEEEKEAVKAWLAERKISIGEEKLIMRYAAHEKVVAMLSEETKTRLGEIPQGYSVITAVAGESDMMLMSRMAAVLGSEQAGINNIKNSMRELFCAYYDVKDIDELTGDIKTAVSAVINNITEGGKIVISLPPVAPFIAVYLNTLKMGEIVSTAA